MNVLCDYLLKTLQVPKVKTGLVTVDSEFLL